MKKVVLSTIMLVSFGMISFAQTESRQLEGEVKAVNRVEMQKKPVKAMEAELSATEKEKSNVAELKQALDLTDEQTEKVEELLVLRREALHNNREAGKSRDEIKEADQKFAIEFKSILTQEQLEKYEVYQDKKSVNKASSLEKEGVKVIEPASKTK